MLFITDFNYYDGHKNPDFNEHVLVFNLERPYICGKNQKNATFTNKGVKIGLNIYGFNKIGQMIHHQFVKAGEARFHVPCEVKWVFEVPAK
jgi:hypothetical protein